jgi:hypothetical protein
LSIFRVVENGVGRIRTSAKTSARKFGSDRQAWPARCIAGDLISRLVWSSPPERLSPGDSGTTAPGLLFEDRLLLGSAIGFQLQPPLCREPIFADGLCLGDIGQEFLLECVSHNAEFSHVLELGAPAYGPYRRPAASTAV